jgi:hypothetical protein
MSVEFNIIETSRWLLPFFLSADPESPVGAVPDFRVR